MKKQLRSKPLSGKRRWNNRWCTTVMGRLAADMHLGVTNTNETSVI